MSKLTVNRKTYCDTNLIESASGSVKAPNGTLVSVTLDLHTVLNASGDVSKWVFVAAMAGQSRAMEFTTESQAREVLNTQKKFFV
jgi:hypothetical protein